MIHAVSVSDMIADVVDTYLFGKHAWCLEMFCIDML